VAAIDGRCPSQSNYAPDGAIVLRPYGAESVVVWAAIEERCPSQEYYAPDGAIVLRPYGAESVVVWAQSRGGAPRNPITPLTGL